MSPSPSSPANSKAVLVGSGNAATVPDSVSAVPVAEAMVRSRPDSGRLSSDRPTSTRTVWRGAAPAHPASIAGQDDFLFPSRIHESPHLGTRQFARTLGGWVHDLGLDPADYGPHSMQRTRATLIYRRTMNLRAVQLLLGQDDRGALLTGHSSVAAGRTVRERPPLLETIG